MLCPPHSRLHSPLAQHARDARTDLALFVRSPIHLALCGSLELIDSIIGTTCIITYPYLFKFGAR